MRKEVLTHLKSEISEEIFGNKCTRGVKRNIVGKETRKRRIKIQTHMDKRQTKKQKGDFLMVFKLYTST